MRGHRTQACGRSERQGGPQRIDHLSCGIGGLLGRSLSETRADRGKQSLDESDSSTHDALIGLGLDHFLEDEVGVLAEL